ncbi:methyltransferase, FxLD system [Nonomuraea sp. WAC 01424]|uniref:methyltransferase, FxLD system n=1 Tax=Nonomuraea sp. WAC 01424 TaxID=2203200 RepID=UPI000F7932BB|nr:methyltransferase, FxLD system [Nonomuraea sp. WAC 01424]RSN11604.1 methyltransferase, FxLD system [Nonomuraea sp. WAC 01424]
MTTDLVPSDSPDRLRADMVSELRRGGWIRSPAVESAFAKVPRDRFAPEAPPHAAYAANDVVITKRGPNGRATSSISAPWLQADMLEAAELRPGAKVLEIGSGGYNAALIAEIVGPGGLVVTIDIDPFVTERASRFLAQTGYGRVKVVLGDAEHAADQHAPDGGFDAVIVTVGVWDVPWGHLLAPDGRMIVPLRFSTISRSFTFVREGGHFLGLDPEVCGFVPCQGAGKLPDQEPVLADGAVRLTLEIGPTLDAAALDRALTGDRTELWTGVTVGGEEPFDSLHLRIATVDERFGMFWQDPDRDTGLVQPAMRWYCPALITRDSFAYLTIRRQRGTEGRWEFGASGHGRDGAELAHRLHDHVCTWDRAWRDRPEPAFTLHPADADVPAPAIGRIFRKRHTQLVMSWPDT